MNSMNTNAFDVGLHYLPSSYHLSPRFIFSSIRGFDGAFGSALVLPPRRHGEKDDFKSKSHLSYFEMFLPCENDKYDGYTNFFQWAFGFSPLEKTP